MAVRTARTEWVGGLMDGAGVTDFVSSGIGTFEVSFPRRTADGAEGVTSPEELIAAAHSSCYSMALSGGIAAAGGTPVSLQTTADVTLGPDPAGGLKITNIKITVRGKVEGMDEAAFIAAAEGAKAGCPISKALAATNITLDAALA